MAERINDFNLTIGINQTGNITADNKTANVEEFIRQPKVGDNVVILIITLVSMLIKMPGCVSLFYSIRVPFNFRYVTMSFMVGILTLDSCIVIIQALVLVYGYKYAILEDLRTVLPNLILVITWGSLAHLAIDRFFFVARPDFHQKHVTRLKVLSVIVLNWCYPIIAVLATYAYVYIDPLHHQNRQLDTNLVVMIRLVTSICYMFYNGVAMLAYLALRRFLRSLENTGSAVDTAKYASTRFLISVTIASSVLQSPYFLTAFVYDVLGMPQPSPGVRMLTFALVLISMILNTFLIISKMQECQYHFTRLFLSCFGKYRLKAKALKVAIYGVSSSRSTD